MIENLCGKNQIPASEELRKLVGGLKEDNRSSQKRKGPWAYESMRELLPDP